MRDGELVSECNARFQYLRIYIFLIYDDEVQQRVFSGIYVQYPHNTYFFINKATV